MSVSELNNENKKVEDVGSDAFMCCGGCCMCIFTLALVAAVISFYVFGIMFLVEDNDLCKQCNGSALWAYVLVTLIITACNGSSAKKDRSPGELLGYLIMTVIINGSLGTWGGIELWVKSCDSLVDSNIWVFGTWTFGLQMTSCFFCLTTILTLCCKLITASDEENKEPNLTSVV